MRTNKACLIGLRMNLVRITEKEIIFQFNAMGCKMPANSPMKSLLPAFLFFLFPFLIHAQSLVLHGKPVSKSVMWVSGEAFRSAEIIRWYISDSGSGEWKELPGIRSKEIVLLSEYKGKFLKCEVTSATSKSDVRSVVSKSAVVAKGNANTDWFKNAGLGLMVHYLRDIYSKNGGAKEWNEAVDRFDTERFAGDCKRAGVSYVMWALGQNDGYYCAPNAAYDSIAGVKPGELCSRRDLPMDLYKSLHKKGIRLMLYLPGNPPHSNKLAVNGFKYTFGKDTPTSQYTQARLEAVIREWSLRYGKKVSGWWFDGMYRSGIIQTRSDMSLAHNISTHTLAAKAGNFESIVTYNYGVDKIQSDSPYDDYSAGEENNIGQLPVNRWILDGIQWFHFTFLGKSWAAKGVRYKTPELTDWAQKVFEKQGVLCFDVSADSAGAIDPEQLAQLSAISKVKKQVDRKDGK